MLNRCGWSTNDELYTNYHDHEWGVPVYEDRQLFEFLILEGAQAGLSWYTVLKKRERYRELFDNFDPTLIAAYDVAKVEQLMGDAGIIRNRLKINAAIENAKAFLKVVDEFGSFRAYIWSFVGGAPRINHWTDLHAVPTQTEESDRMSKDLKKRGFKFVGTTICYAYMQATGMVMDHVKTCFRYHEMLQHHSLVVE